MITYQTMDYADIPAVISLGSLMHQESRYSQWPYDEDYCSDIADRVINEPDNFYSNIAKENNEILGMMFWMRTRPPFCKADIATDLLLYVHPEKRNCSMAVRLIKGYERWARYQNLSGIQIGVTTNINPERTAKFYNRLGYSYSGYLMTKD